MFGSGKAPISFATFVRLLSIISHSTAMWRGLAQSEETIEDKEKGKDKSNLKKGAGKKVGAKKGFIFTEENDVASFFNSHITKLGLV